MAKTNRELMTNLRDIKRLLFAHPNGLSTSEIAAVLRLPTTNVWRYLKMLRTVEVTKHRFTCIPFPDEIEYAEVVLRRADYEARLRQAREPFDLKR